MNTPEKFHILFVDDEEKARKYFNMAISGSFPVLTADSVDSAIKILEQHHESIGVLITDQRMPGKQGVDLLKHAVQEWPGIVRILTTAHSNLHDAIEAVNRGEILRYLTKPWDIQQIQVELKNAMSFFHMRRERDLLLSEKLSVQRGIQAADHLRDLLVMSEGLRHFRHAAHALAAWARDSQSLVNQTYSAGEMELWGMEVHSTNELMQLNRQFHRLTDSMDHGFVHNAESAALLGLGKADEIKLDASLIRSLLSILRPLLNTELKCLPAERHVRFEAELNLNTGPGLNRLPEAYLICWHHGGHLNLAGNQLSMQLARDPLAIEQQETGPDWLEECFTQLQFSINPGV